MEAADSAGGPRLLLIYGNTERWEGLSTEAKPMKLVKLVSKGWERREGLVERVVELLFETPKTAPHPRL